MPAAQCQFSSLVEEGGVVESVCYMQLLCETQVTLSISLFVRWCSSNDTPLDSGGDSNPTRTVNCEPVTSCLLIKKKARRREDLKRIVTLRQPVRVTNFCLQCVKTHSEFVELIPLIIFNEIIQYSKFKYNPYIYRMQHVVSPSPLIWAVLYTIHGVNILS